MSAKPTVLKDSQDWEDAEDSADPCAATRRAIVRAAAAIGGEMP